ncbi:hypothetical protein GUJ93_ZPchr0013g34119 [Zizania palustris]|uniref:PHD-type domain-containing protein n=1 Tax=Zizania palustris TaxID=103762 RepID=A0A8J6C1P9_ZIZPA|nr:hypothetical protein GUJ93_ZPchr0013g34119 [Zizania palustris]
MGELVGRAVRKEFPGFGVFSGVVEAYDDGVGYFRVLYEDGDSEEVDLAEMAGMLVGTPMPPLPQPPGVAAGRRPKKRRRGDEDPPLSGCVVLVVPAGDGLSDAAEPASPVERSRDEANGEVMVEMLEKKRRISPGSESSRPLRRSARQAKAAARAAEMEAAEAVAAAAEAAEAEAAVTPQQSGRKRQRGSGTCRYRSVARDLEDAVMERMPLKPELPPSSQGLDLEGLPVLDVFQVYSCLRSFSRQLFLSPFTLETFVAALRCTYVNPLIDWVHFALLGSMKSHLENLANEGDPWAVHCIRNLNWELLDLATWPIYLAEYLLTRGSELRYGMKLTDLKLLNTEYYIQPTTVKLELLRSLCDDVLEIEVIHSELGSRMSELYGSDELCKSTGLRRKRKASAVKDLVNSSPPPDGSSDTEDGNSDECYLCGMVGNLLCCDGCPAAFHSKCVGVVEDLLPEGDWFCPECLIQKNDGSRNMAKPRGAEVLGIDPHGRLYFGTCGYLLVVESSDVDSPCHYYGHFDCRSLFNVLIPCHTSYSSIVNAISLFWGIAIDSSDFIGRYENSKECSVSDAEAECSHILQSKQCNAHEQAKTKNNGSFEELDSGIDCALDSDQLDPDASYQKLSLRSTVMSENGNETSAKNSRCNSQQDVVCSYANGLSVEKQKDRSPHKKISDCYIHLNPAMYINYYSFGRIAASAAEELNHKLSENKEGKKPGHDATSFQLKTVCKKYANIFALTDQKLSVELLKEKCGWCNSCQISGGVDCIFRVIDSKCVEGLQSEKNKRSHIILAMHTILSIEERLNGLLIGPWKNPQYSIYWRKAVLKVSDVSSLKWPLLMLESSLRRVAFSVEWQKPADSVEVVGSAAHILVRTSNKSSCHGSARKPGRKPSNGELKVDSRDVGVYWWRGGILSRQVFHWKRLPQSLVYKAARQAGHIKIPTILYNDGSEFARRSKYIAWRAAVEMAENVAQLSLQIKELEFNIKWTEILSTLPASLATKETQKIARLFKKVIVRRKRVEGTNVEYLLDFGKRENIPPVIAKYGIKLEDPSSERNRYWLSEGHVPLSLLKAYEAKTLTRLLKKKDITHISKMMTDFKPPKPIKIGFDDLLEKAKKLVLGLCGQCDREVKTSEAVHCQYCEALFHKRHFKVPRGAAGAVYVCNKCLDENVLSVKSPQKKAVSKKTSKKKKPKKQSRKIVTRRNQIVLKFKKKNGKNKGKRGRGRPRKNPLNVSNNDSPKILMNEQANVPKNEPAKRISKRLYDKYMKGDSNIYEQAASCRKKRTASHYPYWKCYSGESIFIACEDCKDWFHGDIYSITIENVNNLIGFKCHRCRLKDVPICPHVQTDAILMTQSDKEDTINQFVEDKEHSCPTDLSAHDSLKELHEHIIEKELDSHSIEKEVGDHCCLKVLEDRNDKKELSNFSNEKELGGHNCLKELDDHNKMKELDGNMEVLFDQNSTKELDSTEYRKLADGEAQSLHELNNHNNLKALDNCDSSKELDSHNSLKECNSLNNLGELDKCDCQKECDNQNSPKELDDHESPKELGCTEDSEHSAAVTQTDDFLNEPFDIRISSKEELIITSESGSIKESDCERSAAVTQTDDFLNEPFDIRISSKEELIIKESFALQSKNNSEENPVPAEHDIDLQVVNLESICILLRFFFDWGYLPVEPTGFGCAAPTYDVEGRRLIG